MAFFELKELLSSRLIRLGGPNRAVVLVVKEIWPKLQKKC
jgi:hypothetical protein